MFGKTTEEKTIRFKGTKEKNEFLNVLRKRVNAYFKEKNITPYANAEMWTQMILSVVCWGFFYGLIMSDVLSALPTWAYYTSLTVAFTLLGFANIFIAFTIAHDASHDAISPKKWVNIWLGHAFNFIGGNIYLLRKIHSTHHLFSNIQGIDPQMESHGLLRNTPHEEYQSKHKYQAWYIHFIYAVAMLHWSSIKDYKWMFAEKHIGNEKNIKHPASEIIILLVSKAIYYTINLVLPLMYLQAPVWVIVLGYVSIHILPGYTFAVIFQANHVFTGTHYPIPDDEGNIENNYALHTLETTMDFARKSKLATYLMGGINVHVIHHMFPHYCHVHNVPLSYILEDTCKEFGIQYMETSTFWKAIRIHFQMIKHLGNPDAQVAAYQRINSEAMQKRAQHSEQAVMA